MIGRSVTHFCKQRFYWNTTKSVHLLIIYSSFVFVHTTRAELISCVVAGELSSRQKLYDPQAHNIHHPCL